MKRGEKGGAEGIGGKAALRNTFLVTTLVVNVCLVTIGECFFASAEEIQKKIYNAHIVKH